MNWMVVASLLADLWGQRLNSSGMSPVSAGNLVGGLQRLVALFDNLSEFKPLLDANTPLTNAKLKQIQTKLEAAVERFKKLSDLPIVSGLEQTLNNSDLRSLLSAIGCSETFEDPTKKIDQSSNRGREGKKPMYLFYFQDSFFQMTRNSPSADLRALEHDKTAFKGLAEEGWHQWRAATRDLGIHMQFVDDERDCNIRFGSKDIDGAGVVLGQSNVGPVTNMVLDLTMDSGEPWQSLDDLQAALTHEIGHLLGVGHNKTAGNLMSPVIPTGVLSPTDSDIRLAIAAITKCYGE